MLFKNRRLVEQHKISTSHTADKVSYSQSGEDLIIDFLFSVFLKIPEISYVDIGANDPIDINNTYYFYKKGFKGVCLDANPLFKAAYKAHRPNDKFVTAGVGSRKSKLKFFEMDPHTLSTFSEESAHLFEKDDGHKILKTYIVPIMTPTEIINKYFAGRSMPNLLNLDVEGWDMEIIRAIDFKQWRPTVICVETVNYSTKHHQQKIKSIFKTFEELGYFAYADTFINTIFVDKQVWDKSR